MSTYGPFYIHRKKDLEQAATAILALTMEVAPFELPNHQFGVGEGVGDRLGKAMADGIKQLEENIHNLIRKAVGGLKLDARQRKKGRG